MHSVSVLGLTVATAGTAALWSGDPPTRTADERAHFAAPIRIQAGDAFLGEKRLYPSPVFHDVDGDGHLDVVVGDLIGRVTVALRHPDRDGVVYAEEQPLKDRRGEQLKFNNW